MCVDVDAASGEALVRQASAVERRLAAGRSHYRPTTIVEFDEASGKVVARRRATFDGLVLDESPAALPSSERSRSQLWPTQPRVPSSIALPTDDAAVAAFRTRVQCLAAWMPDLKLPAARRRAASLALAAAGRRPPLARRAARGALAGRDAGLSSPGSSFRRSTAKRPSESKSPAAAGLPCNMSRAARRSWPCGFRKSLACSKRRESPGGRVARAHAPARAEHARRPGHRRPRQLLGEYLRAGPQGPAGPLSQTLLARRSLHGPAAAAAEAKTIVVLTLRVRNHLAERVDYDGKPEA